MFYSNFEFSNGVSDLYNDLFGFEFRILIQQISNFIVFQVILQQWRSNGVSDLHDDLLGVMFEKTGGNPLMCLKLADKLWQFGMVRTVRTGNRYEIKIGNRHVEICYLN